MPDELMVRVEGPGFVAGLILRDGLCVRAAPYMRWMVGKHMTYIIHYCYRKRFDYSVHR